MIEDYLKNHSFFHNWKAEHIQSILDSCNLETYPRNYRLIEEGFWAEKFFIIVSGLVEIKSMDISLQFLGPGEIVGWSWLVPPYTWSFSAQTIKETITISFNTSKVQQIMDQNKEIETLIYKNMFFVVANRLKIARQKIVEMHVSKSSNRKIK
ncbi:MAG: cyclic nucleotide-binding domain-containing protein [bacterium]